MMRIYSLLSSCNIMLLQQNFHYNNFVSLRKFNIHKSPKFKNKRNIVFDYVQGINAEYVYCIPQQYMTLSTRAMDLYVIDTSVAEQFCSLITDDLLKNTSYVAELNPGLGFITKQLLQNGIPFVHMYEKEIQFFNRLNRLCNKFPDRLSLQKGNLHNISKLMHSNNSTSNILNIYDLLNKVPRKNWSEESCIQIIGATSRITLIRHLILSAVFQTCFMAFGRPTFYLAIEPSIWKKYTHTVLTSTNIMFQTIFDYHLFGKVDRKAFIPWKKTKTKTKQTKFKQAFSKTEMEHVCKEDLLYMYVVKIEPKRTIPISSHGTKDLLYFWHFVRRNLYKPSVRVIPSMESLIPGCGKRLIAKDFNIFTQYRDLNMQQLYDLYLEFRSWPEFDACAFRSGAADLELVYNTYTMRSGGNCDNHSL